MTDANHCPPIADPASDPVLYGVARALALLFPATDPIPAGHEPAASRANAGVAKSKTEE